ncbi:CEP135 [Bugula neritina]|uniref:CEP135 n=1 Tax=Bugula neritina TaxID=10212 RepID=A0A7J7JLV4_BUGNE|nr:CEP135 [Bugula neritina]
MNASVICLLDGMICRVEARDAEIERLGRVLDGGRPYDVVALEARNRSNEKLISHLNIQIDYLQQKNKELERKLGESRVGEANARQLAVSADLEKSNLEMTLKDVDRTARRLKNDKDAVIDVADKEMAEAKLELSKSNKEIEKLDLELSKLRQSVTELKKRITSYQATPDLRCRAADFERLENLVDKVQQDKRKLGVRVNRLVQTEKELVTELDKYKRSKKGPAIQAARLRNRSPNRFDQLIKNLEQERDYWKAEVERLQEVMTYKGVGGGLVKTPNVSPVKNNKVSPRAARSPSRSPVKGRTKSTGRLESAMQVANEERDFYKEEYLRLKSQTSPLKSSATPTGRKLKDSPESSSKLARVISDRDHLQTLVDKFETQLSETQGDVRVVAAERDRLQETNADIREELQRVRQQLMRSSTAATPSLAAQRVLKQVEMEREEALADLRQTTIERDTLRERLQVATETQINERVASDDKIEELHSRLRRVNSERSEVEAQLEDMRSKVTQLEEEVRVQSGRCNEVFGDYQQLKQQHSQLRMLADQGDKSLRENHQRLGIKEDELQCMTNRCQDLEGRLEGAEKVSNTLRSEISQLRNTVAAMDREKDNLQSILDDKTERCARLDQECANQEEKANQLLRNNRDVARQLDHSEDTIKLKDREIHSLRKQVESVHKEIAEVVQTRDDHIRENRLLEDDLTNMTAETQRLNKDIKELIDERAELSDQVQDYIGEVKRVEDVLAQKEDERTQLLEQYRLLSLEAERFTAQTSQLETESHSMRRDLQTKEHQIRRLQEQVEVIERELQQTQISHQSLEGQIANQNRIHNNLEDKIQELEGQKYNLEQDVSVTRDLSARLENSKDTVQRRLAAKELECDRAVDTIDQLEREISALKDRNHSDRQELLGLEQLLASNRDKEFQAQLAVQESSSEVQLMKDRLTLNDSKIDSQTREITQLRNRILDLESDLERSRHQLTNERFEKEKTAQELRRVTELSRSQLSRSAGHMTPSSQALSGRATPMSQVSAPVNKGNKYSLLLQVGGALQPPLKSAHSLSTAPANVSVASNLAASSRSSITQAKLLLADSNSQQKLSSPRSAPRWNSAV